jgi:hypothetical protein
MRGADTYVKLWRGSIDLVLASSFDLTLAMAKVEWL